MIRLALLIALLLPAVALADPPLANQPNGTVLSNTPVDVPEPGVAAARLTYRSTDAKGVPIEATTTILVPTADHVGPRPVVSLQLDTGGIPTVCAPSRTVPDGAALTQIQPLLQRGWAVAVPDYGGPRGAVGAGVLAGHVVLDGVRAVRTLADPGAPFALYGYGYGGQATAWAAQLQPSYAPVVSLAGAALGGTPVDLQQLVQVTNAGQALLALAGLERQYPELLLDAALNDRGRAAHIEATTTCADAFVHDHAGEQLPDLLLDPAADLFAERRLAKAVQENRLGADAPATPLYVFHTAADELVPITGVDAVTTRWCRDGATVLYQRDALSDHETYGAAAAPAAEAWLEGRFAGAGRAGNCGTTPDGALGNFCPAGEPAKFRLRRIGGLPIVRAVVRLDDRVLKVNTGRNLRRIIIRGLALGTYEFEVTRFTRRAERTRYPARVIGCERRR